MMNGSKITAILLLLMLAAGCAHDVEDDGVGMCPDPAEYIAVTASAPPAARGTTISTEAEMTGLGLFCTYTAGADWQAGDPVAKMFDRQMVKSGSTEGGYDYWAYAGAPVEWGNASADDRYTFFAYAPFASAANGIAVIDPAQVVSVLGKDAGRPHISYTVPADNAAQPDLMVAVRRENVRPTGNPVALQMIHALTAVGFHVNGQDGQLSTLSVTGFRERGIAELDGGNIAWSLSYINGSALTPAAPTAAAFDVPLTFDTDHYSTAAGGYLMMIPQTLGADAKVRLTFADGSHDMVVNLDGHLWQAGKRVVYNITVVEGGTVTVTPDAMTVPYMGANAATDNIEVLCEDADGNPAPLGWTLTSADPAWLRMSTDPAAGWAGCSADGTVTGDGSRTVYTFALENSGAAPRTTTVSLLGGTVVNVTQLKHDDYATLPHDPLADSYVGAFWRTGQTGERILTGVIPTAGAWSAYVGWDDGSWNDGDIVFSSDGGAAADGDAESWQVAGSTSALSGGTAAGGAATFRVGLKSRWDASNPRYDPSKPARYAVVVLSYDDYTKYHRIYLRQGEGDDWLMRPSDPVTGGASGRPMAVMFSPYNLTATAFGGAGSTAGSAAVGARGGTLTQWPSQAGAMFQWAHTDGVIAYNPAVPAGAPAGFGTANTVTPLWGRTDPMHPALRIRDTYESCPAGYRRPTDGSPTNMDAVTGFVAVGASELAQSLWQSTATDATNTVAGRYADGFFDRLAPAGSASAAAGSSAAAYTGQLFYNAATGASLFFPLAGYRTASGGLTSQSATGYYLTASSPNATQAWSLLLDASGAGRSSTAPRQGGYSIRCVKAADPTLPGDLEPPTPGDDW